MGLITNEIHNLKETDTWSFLLFALFKTRELPELSPLSELVYILDKSNLLKLCSIFGGTTIKIPTIGELEELIYSLLLYQMIDLEKVPYEEAINKLNINELSLKSIKTNYLKMRELLKDYELSARGKE